MGFWSLVFGISSDAQDVLNLSKGLGMNKVQPTIYLQIQTNCCNSNGITCDSNQRVNSIDWSYLRLNGSINGTIPSTLITMDLSNNNITGTIPNNLSNTLQYLDTSVNKLSGNIPSSLFNLVYFDCSRNFMSGGLPQLIPSTMITLKVFGNSFDGPIPSFPASLIDLYLGYPNYPGNSFSGSVVLNAPISLYLNYNMITDVVVINATRLAFCDLSNNPSLGAHFNSNLRNCIQDYIDVTSTSSSILLSRSNTDFITSTYPKSVKPSNFTNNPFTSTARLTFISSTSTGSLEFTSSKALSISSNPKTTIARIQTPTTTLTTKSTGKPTQNVIKTGTASISQIKSTLASSTISSAPTTLASSNFFNTLLNQSVIVSESDQIQKTVVFISSSSTTALEKSATTFYSIVELNLTSTNTSTYWYLTSTITSFAYTVMQPTLIILTFLSLMKIFIGLILFVAFYHSYKYTKVETVKSRKNVFVFRESTRYTQEFDPDQFERPAQPHKGILARLNLTAQHDVLHSSYSQEIELNAVVNNSEQSLGVSRELGPTHKSGSALLELRGKSGRKKEIELAYRARGL